MFRFTLFSSLKTVVSKYAVARVLRDFFEAKEPVAVDSSLTITRNNWFTEFVDKYDLINKKLKISPPILKNINSYREFLEEYIAITAFIYKLKVLYTQGFLIGKKFHYFGCSYEEFLKEITTERTYFSEVLSEIGNRSDLVDLGKKYGWILPEKYLKDKYLEIGVLLKELHGGHTWLIHNQEKIFFKNMRKISYFLSYYYYPMIYELRKRLREIYGEKVRELIMTNPETPGKTYSENAVVVLLNSRARVLDFTKSNPYVTEKILKS